jgi:hypothetical protein
MQPLQIGTAAWEFKLNEGIVFGSKKGFNAKPQSEEKAQRHRSGL